MSDLLQNCGIEIPINETYIFCAEECDNIDKLNYSIEEILLINEQKAKVVDVGIKGDYVDVEINNKCYESVPIECLLTENEFYNLKSEDIIFESMGSIDKHRINKLYSTLNEETKQFELYDERKMLTRANKALNEIESKIRKILKLTKESTQNVKVIEFDIKRGVILIKIKTNKIWDTEILTKIDTTVKTTKQTTTFIIKKEW